VDNFLTGLAGERPPITQIIAKMNFARRPQSSRRMSFSFIAFAPFARPVDLKIRAIREICG